jgi:hypothetical protein
MFKNLKIASKIYHSCIIPSSQHGFRKGRSVLTTLSETWDDFTRSFDSKSNVDCVYFDIKSAFDTVDISRLIQKLTKYGLGPNSISWLNNFLTDDRSYSAKIGNFISEAKIGLNKGVPQGCILSPLLFNIFVSDLPTTFHDSVTVKQYADDIKAYVTFPNRSQLPSKVQEFIDHLSLCWCHSNGLLLAANKLKILHLGHANPNYTYFINDYPIPKVTESVRDLGIHFSPSLKFDVHTSLKCRSAYFRWFNIFKFFRTKNTLILSRLYKIYVRPVLEYGSIIFNSQSLSLDNKIESTQRKITRMIFRRCHPNLSVIPPYSFRCKALNLQTLKLRRDIFDLTFFHNLHIHPGRLA